MTQKIILITGATSGFGKAVAEKFAANGWNCIITGRRKDRLESIKAELISNYNVKVLSLCFDVQNKKEVFDSLESLPTEWQNINVLVNNAGLALGRDTIDKGDLQDWETMINTNVTGLLYVTKAILPYFIKSNGGHIINLGSVAAKDVYQYGNVYCGTKAAVDVISHSMRIDLLPHKVKVTAIHPGAAETEFSMVRFKGDEVKVNQTYAGIQALSANDVAETIYYCATLPAHVCINDLVITCTAQADGIYIHRT